MEETPLLPIKKHYDVSGEDGQPGSDGRRGSDHRGNDGEQGHPGGDATAGTVGQGGGSLHLRLFDPAGHGRITRETLGVAGQLILADGRREEVADHLHVARHTEVLADARGGDGGDGGDGGRGGQGGRGSDGSDATRYSSADNGDDGGRGGRGGAAGHGGIPGSGGQVVFQVDFRDTDLLVKTRHDIGPGKVGQAGQPGRGGMGGRGGSGGSGISWTETYTTTENGESVTKERSHRRSSGMSGNSGETGPNNNEPVYNGQEQPPGSFSVIITDADAQPMSQYGQVYDLELLEFDIRSGNGDGIFEPGEEILITNLRLRNRPGADRMSTPPGSRIKIYFKALGCLEGSLGEFELNESLTPGEERSFAGPLVMNIKDIDDTVIPQVGEAWKGTDQVVNPCAELESVQHEFEHFEAAQTIGVSFPIEVTPISGAHSIARGGKKKIFWKVRNVSDRSFGSGSALKRKISTLIRRDGGRLAPEHFIFHGPDGSKQLDSQGVAEAIEQLPPYLGVPETEAIIEGHVEIGDEAPFYEEAELRLDLSLGRIDDPTQLRRIQGRAHTVRVAQAYAKTPGSEILLVTNSSSSRTEVEAWRELAAAFGMRLDVWDLAHNKCFPLASLIDDIAGGTVIFLNNEFEVAVGATAATHQVLADAFIDSTPFLEAVTKKAVSFLFVCDQAREGGRILHDLMLPPRRSERHGPNESYSSATHWLEALSDRVTDDDNVSEDRDGAGYIESVILVRVEKKRYGFAFEPKASHLDAFARQTLARVDRLFPTRRYRVTPHFSPQSGNRLWWSLWILKEYDLGTLELTRSVDRTVGGKSGMVASFDAGAAMHSRELVLGEDAIAAFFRSLNFQQKLTVLDRLRGRGHGELTPQRRRQAGEALVDAILADLAAEQTPLRGHSGGGFTARQLRARMKNLRYLAEDHDFASTASPGSNEADLLTRLMGGIEHLGRSQRLRRDALYRTMGWLVPLVVAGIAVFLSQKHLAQFEIYLVHTSPETQPDSLTLLGLPFGLAPEIIYILPALLAPVLSWWSLSLITRRNAQVSSLTTAWVRRLHHRLFPPSAEGDHQAIWQQVKKRLRELRESVIASLEAQLSELHPRDESLRLLLRPQTVVTTAHEINCEPWERFLSAEELEGARAESTCRAADKKTLEADLKAADQLLEAL